MQTPFFRPEMSLTMTPEMEARSVQNIESCRRLGHLLAAKVQEHGATLEDAAIGSMYATFDLAMCHVGGDPYAALAWARTALEVIEASLPRCGSLQ
jgi:hypothetical protein